MSGKQRTFTKGYAEGSGNRNARWGHRRVKVRARIRRVVSPKPEEASGNGGPRDTRAQSGQEGVPQGKRASEVAEGSEAGSTDADVGETTYLYGKVREVERKTGRAVWPRKGQVRRTGMIAERGRPTEGKRRAERDSTPRYAARGRRNPAYDRKGQGSVRVANEAGKGTTTGSVMAFGRAEWDGRNGRWIWQIGWRQRFGRNRWVWWIGWSHRQARWTWRIGWSPCLGTRGDGYGGPGGVGGPCGITDLDDGSRGRQRGTTRKRHSDLGPVFFVKDLLAHTGGCAVRWGRMS
jgi:hypothetical protein